jgi:hypothetical protein
MKALLIIAVLFISGAELAAQTATVAANHPPDVAVLRFYWRERPKRPEPDYSIFSAANSTTEGTRAEPPRATRQVTPNLPDRNVINSREISLPAPTKGKTKTPPDRFFYYQAIVKNTGAKRIEAFSWNYVFTDPVTKKELDSHSFESFVRVKPNKTSTLVGEAIAPPTKIVTVGGLEKDNRNPFDERVIIRCVLYSDGTLWTNTSLAGNDCTSLRKANHQR